MTFQVPHTHVLEDVRSVRWLYDDCLASEQPCNCIRFWTAVKYTMEPSSDGNETMLSGPQNEIPLCGLWGSTFKHVVNLWLELTQA